MIAEHFNLYYSLWFFLEFGIMILSGSFSENASSFIHAKRSSSIWWCWQSTFLWFFLFCPLSPFLFFIHSFFRTICSNRALFLYTVKYHSEPSNTDKTFTYMISHCYQPHSDCVNEYLSYVQLTVDCYTPPQSFLSLKSTIPQLVDESADVMLRWSAR